MSLPTTSYAVLGLLSVAPMSGYDLNQYAQQSIAHFWPISKSQVYAELARLQELGFVEATEIEQERLPDKREYRLTATGERALDDWLAEPGSQTDRRKLGFLVKVFFGHRMDAETFAALVEDCRLRAESELEHLQGVVDALEGAHQLRFQRATALLGVRAAEATLRWVEEVRGLARPRVRR